jgi:hypothetical protein
VGWVFGGAAFAAIPDYLPRPLRGREMEEWRPRGSGDRRDGAGATSAALQRAFAAHAALQRAEDEAWGGVDDRSDEGEDE